MKGYWISPDDDDDRWLLFVDQKSGFSLEVGCNIANVLLRVRHVFKNIFGKDVLALHPVLSIMHTSDVPITFRERCLIFLTSTSAYYLQHIFQFAHELCHFMVPADVCAPYRWFEETLCQAMSWVSLVEIRKMSSVTPCYELTNLYSAIDEYVECDMDNRCSFTGALPKFISQNLAHLKADCEDRPMNNAIAYSLFPVLQEYPELWNIIPHLDKMNGDIPLRENLVALAGLAKIRPSVMAHMIALLCE